MTAQDYDITFPYGATDPPYGTPSMPYHKGDDRVMPEGTPVVVNGVLIGYSGNTGWSTGAHLHIGRWVGGKDTNPSGGGFTVSGAKVTEISQDDTNGKYVRLADADGSSWVYLHLSNNSVLKVGDVLADKPKFDEGDNMYQGKSAQEWHDLYAACGQPNDGDIINWKRFETGDPNFQPEGKDFDFYKAEQGDRGWKRLAEDARGGIQGRIDDLQHKVNVVQASNGDATKWQTLKTLLKELIS